MSDMAVAGNLAKVIAAQERLRSVSDRTEQATQRLERAFGKAAMAGMRLGQVTARPAIVMRDFFSFTIDRLMLQLSNLNHLKIELKLILNDKVIETAKQLRQLLQGLSGTLQVNVKGSEAAGQTEQVVQMVQIVQVISEVKEKKSPIDTWIERLQKIAAAIKDFAAAFQSFGDGFKALVDGIKGIGDGFKSIGDGIKSIGKGIKDGIKLIGEGIRELGDSFKAFGESFAQGVRAILDSFKTKTKGDATTPQAGKTTTPQAGGKTDCCAGNTTGPKQQKQPGSKTTDSDTGSRTSSKATEKTSPRETGSGNGENHGNGAPAKVKETGAATKPKTPKAGKFKGLLKGGANLLKSAAEFVVPMAAELGIPGLDELSSENKPNETTPAAGAATEPKAPKAGKLKGLLKGGSKILKSAGKIFKPLDIGLSAVDVITSDNKPKAAVQAGANLAGSALGAAIGTAILPGLGTIAGGMLGGWVGDKVGGFLGDKFFGDKPSAAETKTDTSLVPSGRESAAVAQGSLAVPPSLNPENYTSEKNFNVKLDGMTVNFPKQEVDHNELAQMIANQLATEIKTVTENQV